MPGLMEEINRRWSGVSAYTPTRRLARPTGRTATAGTAQQILGGGTLANAPASVVSTFGAPGFQPRDRAPIAVPPPQPSEPGGWKGVLSDIVTSPIGRAAMSGLEVLGTPQRAIASSINEVADIFNGGDSSFGDWWEQTFDPAFGMRDVIGDPTGIGWLDSTIAFGLDVATDPLTYVAGAGIYSGISRRARTELAARIGTELGEAGAGLAAKVGKYGPSALSDAERALIKKSVPTVERELMRSGYYWKTPFIGQPHRIPGTGAIDVGIGRTFGRARAGIAAALPDTVRNWRTPAALREAVNTLVTGNTDRMSTVRAAALIEGNKAGDLAKGSLQRFRQEFDNLYREHGDETMAAMRRATENGENTPLRNLYDRMGKVYGDQGGYLEQIADGYQPRILTPEARAWMDTSAGQDFARVFHKDVDLDQQAAHTMQRKLLPRDEPYLVGGREFYVRGKGTIDDLNDEFRRVFPEAGHDLYASDPRTIFNGYLHGMERDIHTLGMINRLSTAGSQLVRRHSQLAGDASEPELLRDLVNQARGSGVADPKALQLWDTQVKAASQVTREARAGAQTQIANLQGSFGVEAHQLVDEVTTLAPAQKDHLRTLLRTETDLAGRLGVPSTRRIGPQLPGRLERVLNDTINGLDTRFAQLQVELGAIDQAAAADAVKWQTLRESGRMPSAVDFPALTEKRRLAAEAAQVSMDRNKLEAVRQRAAENRSLTSTATLNPDDESFVGQVTGNRTGPVGGEPAPPPPAAPMPTHPSRSAQAIRTTTSTQRRRLAAVHPQLERYENRIASKAVDVAASEQRLKDVVVAHHPNVAAAQHHLTDVRRVEADLVARIDELSGVPAQAAQRRELQAELAEMRGDHGILGRAVDRYDQARAPVVNAKRKLVEDRDQLAALQRQQEVAAANLPGAPVDTFDTAALTAAERRRNNYVRSEAGKAQRRLLVDVDNDVRNLAALDRQTPRVAGSRFEVDAAGDVHPRFDEPGVARLVEDRDSLVQHELAEARSELELAAARHNDVATGETRTALDTAYRRVATVQDQVDTLNRRIAGSNKRLVRLLERRQRLVRGAADSEHALVASGDTLRKLDDDVAALRNLRDASTPVEGEPLQNQIARVNEAERQNIHRADVAPHSYRTDWDDVPAQTPASAGVYTPTERALLEDAYSIRRALRGVPDARLSGEQRVALRDANRTIRDITSAPRPGARLRRRQPRDSAAVIDTGAFHQVTGDLDAATAPHLPTFDRLASGRPAANTVQRAKAARQVVEEHVAHAGPMIEAGVLDADHVTRLAAHTEAFDAALAAFETNPSPFLRGQVEQLGGDMARWGATLAGYRAAVDGGVTAGNQVGAFVAAGQLAHEAGHIADQIVQHQAVLADDLGPQVRQELERIRLTDEYETQREIFELADDGRTRHAAGQRMRSAAANLDSLRPTALGPLDDDVDAIFAAGNGLLEDFTGGPDLFARAIDDGVAFHPLQERFRLEALVPRLDAEHTRLVADNRALADAIAATPGGRITYVPAGADRAITMPRDVAEATLAANQRATDEWRDVLRRNSDSLAVIDGRAADEVAQLRTVDPASPAGAQAQQRLAELEPLMRNYARLVGEDNWAADAGQTAITGMISGAEPVNGQILREMLGHDIGEYAATVIRTFNDLVAGRNILDGNEMTALANEMAAVFGDNPLIGAIARAPDLDTARAELSRSFTGASQSMAQGARGHADHLYATLDVAVDSRPGQTGLHVMGEAFDAGPEDLRRLIVDRLGTSDWDPKLTVGSRLRELQVRGERVATMRRGLPMAVPGRAAPRDVAAFAGSVTPEGELASAGWQHVLERGAPAPDQLALRHDATLGMLDADIAASIETEATRAAQQLSDQRQRVVDEINANNLRRREAAHTYNQRLSDIGLELGQTRDKILAVGDDARPIQRAADRLRSLQAKPSNSREMATVIEDLRELNAWRAASRATTPTPAAAAPVPSGPRAFTPEEIEAGWNDLRPPTDAEVQAVLDQARTAGPGPKEWYAPHLEPAGGNRRRLGPVQLPVGTPTPRGYYRQAAPAGPPQLGRDLGWGPMGPGGTGGMRLTRDLWDLGYRNAAEVTATGMSPADIVAAGRRFQTAAPTAPAAAVVAATDEDVIANTEAILVAAAEAQGRLDAAEISEDLIRRRLTETQAQAAKAGAAIEEVIKDGFRPIAENLLRGADGAVMATDLARYMENLRPALKDRNTWKVIDQYTAFFKTWATARPGFHVRNAMSATFMNLVDGVKLGEISRALPFWARFMRNPEKVYAEADDVTRQAIDVVFASGAGGRFTEAAEQAEGLGGRLYRKTIDNRFTRWNQRAGALVEGSARFAMAHDALVQGRSASAALGRVRTFHFDYTEMSEVDKAMRRFVPFWTFMSRNLPLQIEAMWLRPRSYQQYMHLTNNFAQTPDPLTPEYWLAGGAFTVDPDVTNRDSPWLFKPDLPFLGLTEQLEGGPSKMFADINPLFLAPFEAYSAGKKLYSQKEIGKVPEAIGGPVGALGPLLDLIGAAEQGGRSGNYLVDPRAAHVLTSTLPPLEFLQRLLDEGGTRAGRQDETLLRTLGLPVQQLTPELRAQTRRSQFYDRQAARERAGAIARG